MEISIIIPVFNCEKYLEKCLDSVLHQSFQDFEIILVNNGSLDDSAKVCAAYADQDGRIVYVQKEKNSGGAGEPRNKGLEIAKGDYIMFLDADDYLAENALETMYSEIISMDYDVVIAGYHNFSEDGLIQNDVVLEEREFVSEKEVRDYFVSVYPNGEAGYIWNKIYKADIIRHFGVKFPAMQRLEDGFFNVDFFTHVHKCKVIPAMTYHYKLNDLSELYRKSPQNYADLIIRLMDHYYETIEEWGYQPEEVEGEVIKFGLNELEVCFENVVVKNYQLSRQQRKEYFHALKENDRVRYMLMRKKYVARYVRFVMVFFDLGWYVPMRLLVKFKVWMKGNCKGLFLKIKKYMN